MQNKIPYVTDEGLTIKHLCANVFYYVHCHIDFWLFPAIVTRNASQWTPLHCAASGGFDELVSLLIGAEADVGPSDPKVICVNM